MAISKNTQALNQGLNNAKSSGVAKKPEKLFDRAKIAKNIISNHSGSKPDFITSIVLKDLADRLAPISKKFSRALIIAPDTSYLPTTLRTAEHKIEFDFAPTLIGQSDSQLFDVENLNLPKDDYDLIISLFDLGFTDNVRGFLQRIYQSLIPDGLFIAAFLGGSSLNQLRNAWLEADAKHLSGARVRVAPFIDVKDAGALLQNAGFALPVTDKETLNLTYASPLHLMAEIKSLGAANPLATTPPTKTHSGLMGKDHLASAISAYPRLSTENDSRVPATIEIIWMSGWFPHESQQKPLKPGSAQISLSTFLNDKST
ncbi:SAM-dependent methyltransferase, BioC-like [hydrothermal vent metagenome]|uniref:SAM-dependent methyltransferase, BioC-like n=1 Tax=hydrothermal vent metagenome TaxID=652676 RepID=A0A3B0TMM1_9ZZZZ